MPSGAKVGKGIFAKLRRLVDDRAYWKIVGPSNRHTPTAELRGND
jgi:hypothetical protein